MCNMVPGEVVALCKKSPNLGETARALDISVEPVAPLLDGPTEGEPPFAGWKFVHVTGITPGHELRWLTRIAAALADEITANEAVVDFNYRLALAARRVAKADLSYHARQWAHGLNHIVDWEGPKGGTGILPAQGRSRTVGLIDTGVNQSRLMSARKVVAWDYTTGERQPKRVRADHDNRQHGTVVAKILDAILPLRVSLVSAKIADEDEAVTSLDLARIYADMVARDRPSVVNMSVAPGDKMVTCQFCNEQTPAFDFQSALMSRVFELGFPTIPVLAAGNSGQLNTFGRDVEEKPPALVVVALDSRGRTAEYSNTPHGGLRAPGAVAAFGGDPKDAADGSGITGSRDDFGTSFAAPFATAAACAIAHQVNFARPPREVVDDVGVLVRQVLNRVRSTV